MQVAIYGTGNVSWLLASKLVMEDYVSTVRVFSRSEEKVRALAMDAASSNPYTAQKISFLSNNDLREVDIIVLAAGSQLEPNGNAIEHFRHNKKAIDDCLDGVRISESAIVIVVSSPVDYCTPYIHRKVELSPSQIIGFGGDLDTNRLRSILIERNSPDHKAVVIGEHGLGGIPLYRNSEDYDEVARQTRTYISRIKNLYGSLKNTASSFLLMELIDTMYRDKHKIHCVSGFNNEFKCFLTWPFIIGRQGVLSACIVSVSGKAESDLYSITTTRRSFESGLSEI